MPDVLKIVLHVAGYIGMHALCMFAVTNASYVATHMCPTRLETRTKESSVCASSQLRSFSAQ